MTMAKTRIIKWPPEKKFEYEFNEPELEIQLLDGGNPNKEMNDFTK